MKFNIFDNLSSRYVEKVSSLDTLVTVMRKSLRLKQLCETYQELLVKQDIEGANRMKKKKVPAFAPCVFLYGGKSRDNVVGLTGYGIIDIDHIDEAHIMQIFDILSKEPHVVLVVRSISNQGVHIIFRYKFKNIDMPKRVKMSPEKMNKIYVGVVKAVMAYYKEITGLSMDKQCVNMERMMILSHDENLIYNPNAELFSGIYKSPKNKKVTSKLFTLTC